jgi:hypothetical protein
MRALGRNTNRLWSGGGHRITHYVSGYAILHEQVYKQLSSDLEEVLGRL